jgi:hypothetical protein
MRSSSRWEGETKLACSPEHWAVPESHEDPLFTSEFLTINIKTRILINTNKALPQHSILATNYMHTFIPFCLAVRS